jgi:hypothetical protein
MNMHPTAFLPVLFAAALHAPAYVPAADVYIFLQDVQFAGGSSH